MKLSEIKKHPLFPFADFRKNDASFLMLELFWTQVAQEALGEALSEKCVPLQDCERDVEEEYNPVVLDFWIPEIRRGARVILRENYDNQPYMHDAKGDEKFTAYFPFCFHHSFRGVSSPDDEIEQILIHADMSPVAIKTVQEKLQDFLIKACTEEEITKQWSDYMMKNNFPTHAEREDYYDRAYPDV